MNRNLVRFTKFYNKPLCFVHSKNILVHGLTKTRLLPEKELLWREMLQLSSLFRLTSIKLIILASNDNFHVHNRPSFRISQTELNKKASSNGEKRHKMKCKKIHLFYRIQPRCHILGNCQMAHSYAATVDNKEDIMKRTLKISCE